MAKLFRQFTIGLAALMFIPCVILGYLFAVCQAGFETGQEIAEDTMED